MINMNFWKIVKSKWIRDNDPTIEATRSLITKSSKTQEEIDALNEQLNGMDANVEMSIDDISNQLNQLSELGVDVMPFDISFEE